MTLREIRPSRNGRKDEEWWIFEYGYPPFPNMGFTGWFWENFHFTCCLPLAVLAAALSGTAIIVIVAIVRYWR